MREHTNTTTDPKAHCIANNGDNGETEIPFYDCACRECTHMEWELQQSDYATPKQTLKAFRADSFPKVWA